MVGPQTTRDEFDQFIRAEIARWARVVKDAGIPPQQASRVYVLLLHRPAPHLG
jgi:hypothetical protein